MKIQWMLPSADKDSAKSYEKQQERADGYRNQNYKKALQLFS